MNPVEITQGKSFKGLSQYLLHDEGQSQTADRVGFTQTVNLGDVSPDQAWRLMLATANSAAALKEAAGIKKGRAVKNTVHHYSINFNPDDEVTPELIQKAVAESLAVYGMEHHQALAVEHTDKDHRHVHVMVNLINPENGMSAASPQIIEGTKSKRSKLSNSKRKLSSWAQKFERENGLEITEGRLANANKRAQGEDVDARRKSRNKYEQDKREKSADRRKDFQRRSFDDRAKAIQKKTADLKEKHAADWSALKESYKQEKEAIRVQMSPSMKEASTFIKEGKKPEWAALFRRHQSERFHFNRDSKKAVHRIWYGAVSVREMVRQGQHLKALTSAFSTTQQRDIMEMRMKKEQAALANAVKAEIKTAHEGIKEVFDKAFDNAREQMDENCATLKADHASDWQEIKADWKQYNADRRQSFTKQRNAHQSQQRGQGISRGRGMTP